MDDREAPPEDCMRCGACCFSESVRHAPVTGDDHARLGDDADKLVTWIENTAFMRLQKIGDPSLQCCAALVMDPALGTFACSVYESRPQVCRDLERGGGACAGERATKADRPARALRLLTVLTGRDRTSR